MAEQCNIAWVRPALGRRVRDPATSAVLSAAGAVVVWSEYWARRQRDGDIEVHDQPPPYPLPEARPALDPPVPLQDCTRLAVPPAEIAALLRRCAAGEAACDSLSDLDWWPPHEPDVYIGGYFLKLSIEAGAIDSVLEAEAPDGRQATYHDECDPVHLLSCDELLAVGASLGGPEL